MHSLINDKSHFDRHLHKLNAEFDLWNENFFRMISDSQKSFHSLLNRKKKEKHESDYGPTQTDEIFDKPPHQMP